VKGHLVKFLPALIIICTTFLTQFCKADGKIVWNEWNSELFNHSSKQNRLVILDLEAVWCHWCHVMEEETYSNPKVISLIQSHFIAVKVDQDSRPDLSNRYEDYGWPATIIFDSKGRELAKRAGFIPPKQMESFLQAFIDDPTPGPSANVPQKITPPESPYLTKSARDGLNKNYLERYDNKLKGWGTGQKFLPRSSIEYAMRESKKGDLSNKKMAQETLKAARKLLDPVWGGVYQYSIPGWNSPHFEKIISFQADNIVAYSQAYSLWKNPSDLHMAEAVNGFLVNFLKSPDGAFYTSQDADLMQGKHSGDYFALNDKGRRAKGIPRIDKHIYSRENGWIAESLGFLFAATGDEKYLDESKSALAWILKNRSLSDGGFRHDLKDAAGPYLGDSLAMGRAFLAVYMCTTEREWLKRAENSANYIESNFSNIEKESNKPYGFLTSKSVESQTLNNVLERDENISLARFANLLFQFTGNPKYKNMAEHAMRYSVTDGIAQNGDVAAVLLADNELATVPLHLTVVGKRTDPATKALFRSALAYPVAYKRTEIFDKREGKPARDDVSYPELEKSALFICTANRCSLPIFDPKDVSIKIDKALSL
jgi:uncharacterized protein YyaL (SSP411 family)